MTPLEQAKRSILAATIGSCECNTKSPDAAYHAAYCRYLKLLQALDSLDDVSMSAAEIDDLNPDVKTRWRMSRMEMLRLGLRCIWSAVR